MSAEERIDPLKKFPEGVVQLVREFQKDWTVLRDNLWDEDKKSFCLNGVLCGGMHLVCVYPHSERLFHGADDVV